MELECNLCGSHKFKDMNGREKVMCATCRSLERTRLLFLYLKQLDVQPTHRILHVAPERGVYWYLEQKVLRNNYICADFDPDRYKFAEDCRKIDLCDLADWPSNDFDLILHSHVLEHTMCNIAYTLYHLHRMLKPSGMHVFLAPIRKGKFDECFADITDEERTQRFGQADHMRLFGRDDVDKHLGMIVRLPEDFDAVRDFGEETLTRANIPERLWRGLHGSTVIQLRKDDYLLSDLGG